MAPADDRPSAGGPPGTARGRSRRVAFVALGLLVAAAAAVALRHRTGPAPAPTRPWVSPGMTPAEVAAILGPVTDDLTSQWHNGHLPPVGLVLQYQRADWTFVVEYDAAGRVRAYDPGGRFALVYATGPSDRPWRD